MTPEAAKAREKAIRRLARKRRITTARAEQIVSQKGEKWLTDHMEAHSDKTH